MTASPRWDVSACVVLMAMLVGACGSSQKTPAPTTIAVPQTARTPLDQCLIDAGFRPVKTRPPDSPLNDQNRVLEWERTVPGDVKPETAFALMKECNDRFVPERESTEAEIRTTYATWVDEYQCLVGMGYHPNQPPSAETFIDTWNTGPWMPIDGVPMETMAEARYREVKERCTLEFYDRG